MNKELRHILNRVAGKLGESEWGSIFTHIFNNQAVGDIPYASSTTQLEGRAIGNEDEVLTVKSGVPSWEVAGGGVSDPHGAAQHTDVTRVLFISATSCHITGAKFAKGYHGVVRLADGANQTVYFEFEPPDDFVTFTRVDIVWSANGGTAGQDWRLLSGGQFAGDNEVYNIHSDSPAQFVIDVVANDTKYVTDSNWTLTNLAKSDTMGLAIQRRGTDGTDTYEGNIEIWGIRFVYTAEQ